MARTFENLEIDRVGTDGRVGRLTLNRPEKMNTLSQELIFELNDALHDLEADDSCRVIILRGAGRTFCAGYDLTPPRGPGDGMVRRHKFADEKGRRLVMGVRTSMQQVTDVQMYFWNMAKVTIAQVHGYALAGGCELAMMADLVTAADDAQLGHPGVRGLGVARNGLIWPLVLQMRKAKELYYTGSAISGKEAAEIGMVNHSWPKEELEARTTEYADRIANLTADHLAILKVNMNRFYENMGIYSSVRSSTDLDAMGQFTGEAYLWQDKVKESMEQGTGLKGALDWRDGRYRDYRAGK